MKGRRAKEVKMRHREQGSILVAGIIVLASMVILILPFIFHKSSQLRLTEKSYRSYAALSLAEAGVERAIWELNFGDISTWEGNDTLRTKSISSFQAADGDVIGDINISVYNPTATNPVVEASGSVSLSGAQKVVKTIRVELEQDGSPLFDCGVFADSGVTVDSNVIIQGNIGTNGTAPNSIYLRSNSQVLGDAICGPGGDPESAIYLSGSASISGEKRAASEVKEFPSVEVPTGLPFQGSFYKTSGTTVISEDGEYSSFILDSNAIVEISGDVTLYVTGEFSLLSNAQLQIQQGSSLTVYLDAPLNLSSNCEVNTSLQDATKLAFYGTDNVTGLIELNSNATIYGAVYMPNADLVLSSNIGLVGAIYGKSIELNSNVTVVFDEGLGGLSGPAGGGGTGSYVVKSWQENPN
ncbi:MAG: hypothetical protein ACE5LC_00315 [Candidatus Aminicenantales bacterium]